MKGTVCTTVYMISVKILDCGLYWCVCIHCICMGDCIFNYTLFFVQVGTGGIILDTV